MICAKPKMWVASSLLGILLLVVAAGCGSGGSATASEPLTKSQFLKRASAICEREDEAKARRLEKAVGSGTPLGEASQHELKLIMVKVILPLYQELISEMASLTPPAKEKKEVARVINQYKATLKEAEADPIPMITNDPFWKPDKAAIAYGIENCSL